MRTITLLSICLGLFGTMNAQLTTPPSGDNQKSVVTQYIGALAHVTVTYNSPNVTAPNGEDRTGKIWGQLVPYGFVQQGFGLNNPAPWRAGANECTTFEVSHDVLVQGKPLPAGRYGFFVVPRQEGTWTVIFSKNADGWGSYFYEEKDDALRVEATPIENEYREWLTYEFTDRQPNKCTVALMWEKTALPITIEVPRIEDHYVGKMRKELQGATGFNYNAWVQAVNYCVQNNTHLEEALTWADAAIGAPFVGQKNFATLSAKAGVLAKMGKADEAATIMDEAIRDPATNANQIHTYGRQLIAQGNTEEALKVMKYNYERFDGAWPTPVSMMRALSAAGQYDEALKYAEKALPQAPDDLNRNGLKDAIEKLKKKQDVN